MFPFTMFLQIITRSKVRISKWRIHIISVKTEKKNSADDDKPHITM